MYPFGEVKKEVEKSSPILNLVEFSFFLNDWPVVSQYPHQKPGYCFLLAFMAAKSTNQHIFDSKNKFFCSWWFHSNGKNQYCLKKHYISLFTNVHAFNDALCE